MVLPKIGLVGTGYAAKLRAETLVAEPRWKDAAGASPLVAIASHSLEKATEFSQPYGAEPMASWQELVQREDLTLIIISTINRDHGAIARAALKAGKHVVVEYPLALDVAEARDLIALAAQQKKLLHVEHIELLSGIHQALKKALPEIGTPFYARYSNINPQRPAPQKWTYQPDLFGFPLIGALSRIHRMTNLFGQVSSVSCEARYWSNASSAPVSSSLAEPYTSCLCTAQLRFANGLVAEVIYSKGEALWKAERSLTIHGERGGLLMDGEAGTLVTADATLSLDMGSRRGLFLKDTTQVMEHLLEGKPLYVTPDDSLYAMRVADAARRSAETGLTIAL